MALKYVCFHYLRFLCTHRVGAVFYFFVSQEHCVKDVNTGPSLAGGQWCPAPPFEIGSPHFTFGPPVAAYIQYCILKMCPPAVFWPLHLVFGPPWC